ncbi:MAG TPA: ABC transporter ATP-binding protein [Actinomycetes bacterium]|nr:ABC transporter ATP-binding protein [Actinomycetes bacterium]
MSGRGGHGPPRPAGAGAAPDARRAPPVVECRGVTRRYPGVVACSQVDLDVRQGEVHAIVGENGAGKSTLMRMLYGLEHPDEGEILVRGRPERIDSPRRAIALGIGMVHQHFMLVEDFTVAENVVLGAEPGDHGRLDLAAAVRSVRELADRFGTPLDPDARVEDLAVGQQQRVEILKVLYRGADILILDEPTAVLVPQEVDELLTNVAKLRDEGKTILFIAHSLDEVLRIADRVTVLRDGRVIGTVAAAGTTTEQLAEMMVGRPVLLERVQGVAASGDPVLRVEGLRVTVGGKERVAGVDLTIRSAEVYGLAGVEGNGQAELVEALIGLRRPDTGRILLGGDDLAAADVRSRRAKGVAYIPEDRHARGMVLPMATWENSVLGQHNRPPFERLGVLNPRAMRRRAADLVRRFRVKTPSISAPGYTMSGGNQQKLVLAREFASQPRLLIAAHPTRGLDVGATEFVWRQLIAARDAGMAVLLVSANLEEILALSDRVGVLHGGRLVAELPGSQATMSELGLYMTGARRAPPPTSDPRRETGEAHGRVDP